VNQQNETEQDEISIRELIETIWKGKLIIVIVTIFAILTSSIVSFFILPKKYSATASLSVKPITIKLSALDSTVVIVDYLAIMPTKTKADYIGKVTSSQVLENTIEKLGLKDANGNTLSVSELSSMITVTNVMESDRILVTINSTDPQNTALIANTLSQEFKQIVADDFNSQIQGISDSITKQLSDGEALLSEKIKTLNDYRSGNTNIDLLEKEIEVLIDQITEYQMDLQDLETQIAADTVALQTLESVSPSTDLITSEDFNIGVGLGNETLNPKKSSAMSDIIISPDSLQDSLLTININYLQTRLITNQAKKEALETQIPEMESALTDSQVIMTRQEYEYNVVNNDMLMVQKACTAYQQRSMEVLTYSSSDIGKSIIFISSEAPVPGGPISPNKKKIIAITAMLGFSLSVFFVLFRNYWRRTKSVPSK